MNGELVHIINTIMMLKYCLNTGEFIVPTEHSHYNAAMFDHIYPNYTSADIRYWLVELRNKRGVQDARLVLGIAGHPAFAGFANAIPTGIVTYYPERATLWTGTWSRNEGQNKWIISYSESEIEGLPFCTQIDENPCEECRQVFTDISALSHKIDAAYFSKNHFERAIAYLDGEPPCEYSNFILCDKLPEKNRRVLCAVEAGWVFGTMGSWSDLLVFDDNLRKEYDRLSSELYRQIHRLIMFAVNT